MTTISVFGDWGEFVEPQRLGQLRARAGSGREIFEFEFDGEALAQPDLSAVQLDPRLQFFEGPQYPPQGSITFGMFADASPDRWGRLLMDRRRERDIRAGRFREGSRLHESDYLLGVHDCCRVGAIRLKEEGGEDFLDNQKNVAAPPFVELRALQAASLALERDEDNSASDGDEWLRMLIAPGGSLGGARPKASVVDPNGSLWIAKFPSKRDKHDIGAWELVVHTLARQCALRVPEAGAKKFANDFHTFLVRRFDRSESGSRRQFASAMTLTGHTDGDDASTGASYLEIASVLVDQGAQAQEDLRELWSRIVFNILVSNCDDHLRNHGFLLVPRKGWRLSEAYDMNPEPNSTGLRLNISEVDNALDLELALSVAPYFRLSSGAASEIVEKSIAVVRQWPKIASTLRIPQKEQEMMAVAFRMAR